MARQPREEVWHSGRHCRTGRGRSATDADLFRVWLRYPAERRIYAAMAVRLRPTGLSLPQFDLISTLTEKEGMRQQELSERLYVTKGNVSGLVDRLVAGGLVERRALANDRRSHALYLTAKGRALAEEGIALQRAYVAETLGRLDRRHRRSRPCFARLATCCAAGPIRPARGQRRR
jgi:DNA-binding MarR family transcriptional regulator